MPLTWEPLTAGAWMAQVQDQPHYVLQDLLPADANILMSGKAKRAFKSWMVDTLCAVIASGVTVGPLVPVETKGVPVLSLAAEGPRAATRDRKLWLSKGMAINIASLDNYFFAHRESILLDDREWVFKIKAFIVARGIKFLTIDPLVMFTRSDENDVRQMAGIMRVLNEFRALGVTVLFVHHLRKDQKDADDDPDEEIRGTSALAGFYDQHWAFRQRHRWMRSSQTNELILRSKDDEEKLFEVSWSIEKALAQATLSMMSMSDEANMERRTAELKTLMFDGEPVSRRRIEEMLGIENAGDLLTRLVDGGILVREGRNYRLEG